MNDQTDVVCNCGLAKEEPNIEISVDEKENVKVFESSDPCDEPNCDDKRNEECTEEQDEKCVENEVENCDENPEDNWEKEREELCAENAEECEKNRAKECAENPEQCEVKQDEKCVANREENYDEKREAPRDVKCEEYPGKKHSNSNKIIVFDCTCGKAKLALPVLQRELLLQYKMNLAPELPKRFERNDIQNDEVKNFVEKPKNECVDDEWNEQPREHVEEKSEKQYAYAENTAVVVHHDEEDDEGYGVEFDWNCCSLWGHHWRQFTSVLPGILLMAAATYSQYSNLRDLHNDAASSIANANYSKWYKLNYSGSYNNDFIPRPIFSKSSLVIGSYFVASIFGNILGGVMNRWMKKRTIYYIASALYIFSGLIPMYLYRYSDVLILQERGISGFTHGLVQVTLLVHTSDIASKRMRQKVTAIVLTLAALAMFSCFALDLDLLKIGLADVIMGGSAMLLTPFVVNETPVFHLLRREEGKALKKFVKLHSESKPSKATLAKFEDLKQMVDEDIQNGKNICGGGNWRPLWMVLNARLMSTVMTSAPFYLLLSVITTESINNFSRGMNFYGSLTMLVFARLIFTIVFSFLASFVRSDIFANVFALIFSLSAAGVFGASFFFHLPIPSYLFSIVSLVIVGVSVLTSTAVDYNQFHQSVEAFSTTTKSWSLAFVGIVENLLNLGLIGFYLWITLVLRGHNSPALLPMTIIVAFAAIGLLSMSKNTRKLTVRQTRRRYNKVMPKKAAKAKKQHTEV